MVCWISDYLYFSRRACAQREEQIGVKHEGAKYLWRTEVSVDSVHVHDERQPATLTQDELRLRSESVALLSPVDEYFDRAFDSVMATDT
jgi:hypothetical protein